MTTKELIALAKQAGFGGNDDCGMAGDSEFDEQLYVEEYPCGEAVLALAKLLGVEITT